MAEKDPKKVLRNLNYDSNDPLENPKGCFFVVFISTILCFPFLPLLVA